MADDPTESRNSDYDFADLADAQDAPNNEAAQPPAQPAEIVAMEPVNDQEPGILNPFNHRLDFNVLMVLNNYEVDNDVFERFAANNITFNQLCYLEDGDLFEMGILDPDLRLRMLDDFQNYINDDRNFIPGMWPRRELSVIDFIHQQLTRMDTLIAATMLNIGANPSLIHAPGVVLHNSHQQFFSPEAVLHLLSGMSDHISDMQRLVANLRDEESMQRQTREIEGRHMLRYLTGIGAAILLVGAGVMLNKRFGK